MHAHVAIGNSVGIPQDNASVCLLPNKVMCRRKECLRDDLRVELIRLLTNEVIDLKGHMHHIHTCMYMYMFMYLICTCACACTSPCGCGCVHNIMSTLVVVDRYSACALSAVCDVELDRSGEVADKAEG